MFKLLVVLLALIVTVLSFGQIRDVKLLGRHLRKPILSSLTLLEAVTATSTTTTAPAEQALINKLKGPKKAKDT